MDLGSRLADQRMGPYSLRRPIGEGPSGTVYDAIDTRDNRRVAVKVLNPTGRARLRNVRLDDPHVVRIIEWNDDFIASEFIDGKPLAHICGTAREEALAKTARIVAALGVAHGNLTEHNVIVAGDRIVLTDFGATATRGDDRRALRRMGLATPRYGLVILAIVVLATLGVAVMWPRTPPAQPPPPVAAVTPPPPLPPPPPVVAPEPAWRLMASHAGRLTQERKYGEAVSRWREAVLLQPDNTWLRTEWTQSLLLLADQHVAAGDLFAACQAWEDVDTALSGRAAEREVEANWHERIAHSRQSRAVLSMRHGIRKTGTTALALLEGALEAWERAIALDPALRGRYEEKMKSARLDIELLRKR